ncbi:MAG: dephospho-CoA kinase [Bacteroidaceae bacterium]|nr:dephospho-CoA kinase [Bacteroidaceae bacterium]
MTHTLRIGITGGIGSGKSYVARIICETYHWPLYDSDQRAKQLMTSSPDVRQQLVALLGDRAYLPDGQLNRRHVADYLFSSQANAASVNAIVHPAVRHDWLRFASEQRHPVVIESAILVEAGLEDAVDVVVAVTAPEPLRIRRAMLRDATTEQRVRERMMQQMPEAGLLAHADYVIVNDGRPLLPQINNLVHSEPFTAFT